MATEVADLFVILRAETAPFVHGMKEAAVSGESVTSKMGGVGKAFSKLGAATVSAGIGVAVTSVKMASDFNSATTRLVTSAGETQNKLDMVRKGLLALAPAVGVGPTELAKSLYYVEAAGFHASDGLTVLKAAAQGAAAEGADTTTVAQALTDVLKDYHLKASAAGDVTSKMIMAVAHGKVSLQDFSASFASIVPAASAAGISFNDVGAALSSMTNHGFTAQRASQNLAQALRSLLKPTIPMEKAFKQFGVSTDTLKAKLHGPNGLTDAMQYLSQAATQAGKEGTPEFAAAMRALMGTAPGANAALTTVGANFKDTTDTIKAMAGATVDSSGKVAGFALVQKNLGQQVKQLKAGLDSLLIQLGEKLIPIIQSVIGFFLKHKTATEALAIAIGAILAGSVIKFVSGALSPLFKGLGLLGKGFSAAKQGLSLLSQGFQDAQVAGSAFSGPMGTIGGKLRSVVDGVKNLAQAGWSNIASGASSVASKVSDLAQAGWGGLKSGASTISGLASAGWSKIVTGAQAIGGAMKAAALGALEFSRNTLAAAVSAGRSAVAFVAEKVALIASAVAEKAAAAAEWLLNFALDANPIMLIVLAIAALVAAIVYAYTHFKWFREGVQEAFKIIGTVTLWLWHNVFEPAFKAIGSVAMWLWHNVILPAAHGIASAFSALASGASAAFSWIIHAGEGAARWLMALPGKILGWFASAGQWLWNAGVHLIEGLWNGIVSMGSWITNQITGFIKSVVPGPVLKILGIFSPSKVFHEIGVNVTKGLVNGITSGHPEAVRASSALARGVIGGASLGLSGVGRIPLASQDSAGGGVTVINVTVQGHVLRDKELFDIVQTQATRYNRRNPTNGLVVTNR